MQLGSPSFGPPKNQQDIVDILDNFLAHLELAMNYAWKEWGISTAFNCTQASDGKYSITDVEYIKHFRPSNERAE